MTEKVLTYLHSPVQTLRPHCNHSIQLPVNEQSGGGATGNTSAHADKSTWRLSNYKASDAVSSSPQTNTIPPHLELLVCALLHTRSLKYHKGQWTLRTWLLVVRPFIHLLVFHLLIQRWRPCMNCHIILVRKCSLLSIFNEC